MRHFRWECGLSRHSGVQTHHYFLVKYAHRTMTQGLYSYVLLLSVDNAFPHQLFPCSLYCKISHHLFNLVWAFTPGFA